jgi:rod shape-determining protein MreC
MKRGKSYFSLFVLSFLIALLIFFFLQNQMNGVLQTVTLPVQRWLFSVSSQETKTITSQEKLQQENNDLRVQLGKMQEIERDNKALHDQFSIAYPAPKKLIPANVIGSKDDTLLIDRGIQDSLSVGDVVVLKDNLIGKISHVTPHISLVTLITSPTTSFTATTVKTSAIGTLLAQGSDSIIFANVVLSDKLEKNDLVETKGDVDAEGKGYPPKLIIGKIVSVNKQASSLFQDAKVESLVDLGSVRMVFVIRP